MASLHYPFNVYFKSEQYDKALEMSKIIYNEYIKAFGEDHPFSIAVLRNEAVCYLYLKQNIKAAELLNSVYNNALKIFGEKDQFTIETKELIDQCLIQ